jgi:hypothetical protein
VVGSSNRVATGVLDFHGLVGIESDRQSWEARRWMDAAAEAKDKAGSVTIALKVLHDRGWKG